MAKLFPAGNAGAMLNLKLLFDPMRGSIRESAAHRKRVPGDPAGTARERERGVLGVLRFAADRLGDPHPELRLVTHRLRSGDTLRRGDLFGARRSEIGDLHERAVTIFLPKLATVGLWASVNRSHTPATEWLSKYSAASWSDCIFGAATLPAGVSFSFAPPTCGDTGAVHSRPCPWP